MSSLPRDRHERAKVFAKASNLPIAVVEEQMARAARRLDGVTYDEALLSRIVGDIAADSGLSVDDLLRRVQRLNQRISFNPAVPKD